MSRLREVMAAPWKPLPKDHGRLSAMDASYTYLRQFTPDVLAVIDFKGGPGTTGLMAAVAVLKKLNETGGRKVPADAPGSFVAARYAGYLAKARKSGDGTAYRYYWELCVILSLRDGLRSGDVYVPGSRRYADPATYLYTPAQWQPRQAGYCQLVGKPSMAADALEQGKEELHTALAQLENTLAGALPDDTGTVRLDEDEHLVIPPLTAEDISRPTPTCPTSGPPTVRRSSCRRCGRPISRWMSSSATPPICRSLSTRPIPMAPP